MWGKKSTAAEAPSVPGHITRRVSALATADLTAWADQAIYTTGRYLTLYGRTGDARDLEEALTGAQVLHAIVAEIKQRGHGLPPMR